MPTSFVARVSRWRTGLMVLGAAVFVAAGIFLLGIDGPEQTETRFWGWASIIFFGLAGMACIPQLFRTEPVLEIDSNGILWRRWSEDRIPWSAIVRAEIKLVQRQKFLSLWLRDPERYRSTRLIGKLGRANKTMGFGDIALNLSGTDQGFDAMIEVISQCAPQLVQPR
ncbi:MAG: STM3941 family protein [Sphingomonas sp.]